MGMWVPVHRDEWDSEMLPEVGTTTADSESGEVVFRSGALPWKTGIYEVVGFCVRSFSQFNSH
jgi:phosphatidylethanolamine N-methyltransferase